MSILISEQELPLEIDVDQAVEAAYSMELAQAASDLQRNLPVLIECDKELSPFVFVNLRARLRPAELRCLYLDGLPREDDPPDFLNGGIVGMMLAQLRNAVRGAIERRVVVLPHLDLLTTSHGGLSSQAKEVIALLYENPDVVWLGFRDPSVPLPSIIENLFPHRCSLLGVPRRRLQHLITQKESRKFGRQFNLWQFYKYVSGMNAVRLRKLLSTLEGEDYPTDPEKAFHRFRQLTLTSDLVVPNTTFDDIGGYSHVKRRLEDEVFAVFAQFGSHEVTCERERLEALLVRGVILTGPSSNLKRKFARAIAHRLNAVFLDTAAPTLKSRYFGSSEANIRQLFRIARRAAPAVIFVSDFDALAAASNRTASDVELSMLSQFVHEMESLDDGEWVFVIGEARRATDLDPVVLQPRLFELVLEIGNPNEDDRREILRNFSQNLSLSLTDEALERAVTLTTENSSDVGPPNEVNRLGLLCRNLARLHVRAGRNGPLEPKDVEHTWAAMTVQSSDPALSKTNQASENASEETQYPPARRRRRRFIFWSAQKT